MASSNSYWWNYYIIFLWTFQPILLFCISSNVNIEDWRFLVSPLYYNVDVFFYSTLLPIRREFTKSLQFKGCFWAKRSTKFHEISHIYVESSRGGKKYIRKADIWRSEITIQCSRASPTCWRWWRRRSYCDSARTKPMTLSRAARCTLSKRVAK